MMSQTSPTDSRYAPCADCGVPCRGLRCFDCFQGYRMVPEWRQRASSAQMEAQNRPSVREKKSEAIKTLWLAGLYDDPDVKERHRRAVEEAMGGPGVRERHREACAKTQNRPEISRAKSERTRSLWQDPEYREKLSGENNGMWCGGTSIGPYTPDWKTVAKSTRRRDGHRCVACGTPEDEENHPVHHIDSNKGNNIPSNLTTLCRKCHSEIHRERAHVARGGTDD